MREVSDGTKEVFLHQVTTEGHAQPRLVTIAFFSSDLGEARRDEGVEGQRNEGMDVQKDEGMEVWMDGILPVSALSPQLPPVCSSHQ